jgi:mono/diheme cytochrome c family protein
MRWCVPFVLVFSAVAAAQSTAPSSTTVWQGVYSEAQAARGKTEYTTHCASCHRDDLSGYNDILKGARFMEKNRESTLHLFFDKTRKTNPKDGAWMLTHSIDPVRTGNPQPADGEREAAQAWPLGPQTYRLLVSAAYAPAPLKGHRVEVRGFLIRRPTETRLNITSLETLDPSCGE